jgi:hypothetical protein
VWEKQSSVPKAVVSKTWGRGKIMNLIEVLTQVTMKSIIFLDALR